MPKHVFFQNQARLCSAFWKFNLMICLTVIFEKIFDGTKFKNCRK